MPLRHADYAGSAILPMTRRLRCARSDVTTFIYDDAIIVC